MNAYDQYVINLTAYLASLHTNSTSPPPQPTLHWQQSPTPMPRYRVDSMASSSNVTLSTEDDIESELFEELRQTRQVPYRDYVCHRCNIKGHMIRDCPSRASNAPTPYQGDRESSGEFNCQCGHRWRSDRVFANKAKECNQCGRAVFASKMYKKVEGERGGQRGRGSAPPRPLLADWMKDLQPRSIPSRPIAWSSQPTRPPFDWHQHRNHF